MSKIKNEREVTTDITEMQKIYETTINDYMPTNGMS